MIANEIIKDFHRYMLDPILEDGILFSYEENSTMYIFLHAIDSESAEKILERIEHHLYTDGNLDKVNLEAKKCYDIEFADDPDQSLWDNYVIVMSAA